MTCSKTAIGHAAARKQLPGHQLWAEQQRLNACHGGRPAAIGTEVWREVVSVESPLDAK